jgi:WD40 repeat protein
VAYHPEEYHIVTGGSDRQIAYWENVTGKQIRELEGSKSAPINGLDIDTMGNYIVTASGDKLVKVNFDLASFFFYSKIGSLPFSSGVIKKVISVVLVLAMAVQ